MKRTIKIAALAIPLLLAACGSKPAQPEGTTSQPAQAPAQPFLTKIQARDAAIAAAQRVVADALAALGKS